MKTSGLTYSEAAARLEEIMKQMENGEQDVDTLVTTLKEAKTLLSFCKKHLYNVDKNIQEILSESANDKD